MKLRVVACGVFEPELTELAVQCPNEVHLHFLDAGLHATPDLLREQTQAQIDAAVGKGYEAIIFGYGLCGRGTSSLLARDAPVLLPRVHDCMTLFLGSREEYRRQFTQHPGTFYTTPGWYEKKCLADRLPETPADGDPRSDPRFPDLAARYGEQNAADIIRFHDSWKRNYTRSAFIDTGVGDRARYEQYARDMAAHFGWSYERLRGDTSLLAALLAGRWDDDLVFVLEPGQRSVLTGDDRIFGAIEVGGERQGEGQGERQEERQEDVKGYGRDARAPAGALDVSLRSDVSGLRSAADAVIGLGIDAGGTYTDCVLYDLKTAQALGKSKALTTHHALLVGIDEALDELAIPEPARVRLVALSTTLATNSIVEGKGGLPGAIIMSAAAGRDARSAAVGSHADIPWKPLTMVRGQMGIDGSEMAPPDGDEIARAVDEMLQAGVNAFAVSGYASVKNPAHELFIKDIIGRRCDLPVVCGHELSSRLNYVNRANTAILNARLLPVVRELLEAVEESLARRGIRATLMVVKGDGSLLNRETALARPIETILSGPAASVSGAKHLTGLHDAIILDMGGTTTDTAVIEEGLVRIDPEGALVGGWRTSVEAADISTSGLGGDSYLGFTADRKLLIGPRRVVPLAYLCHRHPRARQALFALDPGAMTDRSTPAALDFFVLARPDYDGPADERERRVMYALRGGPLSRAALAARLGVPSGRLVNPRRLEEMGVVQRSALTPTDLLHVTGEFAPWDVAAADHALRLFAGMYGLPPGEMIERVRQGIVERLTGQIIQKELPGACADDPDGWPRLLHTAFRPRDTDRLRAAFHYSRPIVAIGAPVRPFFPAVGRLLGAEVVIPPHAEVANAIGAIAGEVVVRERAVVRPGEIAAFVVHTRAGRTEHAELVHAVEAAKDRTASLARERAQQSGTTARDVRYNIDERKAFSAEGEEVLVEVLVEATVSGKPELKAAT